MKIAILADLHLTDCFETAKMKAFIWALDEVKRCKADLICCAGDITATGNEHQSRKILEMLTQCGVPFCSTPGNAERRSFSGGEIARAFDIPPPAGVPVFTCDTSTSQVSAAAREQLAKLAPGSGHLLVSHYPAELWDAEAKALLDDALHRRAVTAVIAGHEHHDNDTCLRGIDPDKSSGGAPKVDFFTAQADGSWERSCSVMPGVDPAEWQPAMRKKLLDLIGVAAMQETFASLESAAELHIPHVELRFNAVEKGPELLRRIDAWRNAGGKTLSYHLPDLYPNADTTLKDHVRTAVDLKCDRLTLHVPRVTPATFPQYRSILLENCRDAIAYALENGVAVGIENLHTTENCRTEDTRNYGCCIKECISWIEDLRSFCKSQLIGFHCDIGHARNNAPISSVENLSDYYAQTAKYINGWHFHQVTQSPDGNFHNHMPLTGFFNKLIVLSGFLINFSENNLPQAPIFLEIRGGTNSIDSWKHLHALLEK